MGTQNHASLIGPRSTGKRARLSDSPSCQYTMKDLLDEGKIHVLGTFVFGGSETALRIRRSLVSGKALLPPRPRREQDAPQALLRDHPNSRCLDHL